MFRYEAPFVVNEKGKVIDTDGQLDTEGRHISAVANREDNKLSQQWDIVYIDDMTFPEKGDLNPDFGLIIERPFFIISQLESNRYLDIVNNH
jgi:hypothetical protein